MVIDADSLQILKAKSTLEHVPCWQDKWTSYQEREVNFFEMPIITEGKQLFVFGRERANDKSEIKIFINIYEIHPDSFKYKRQITLFNKKGKPFSKDSNNFSISKSLYWATNGPVILCFDGKNKAHWFDSQTGKKISKTKFWSASDTINNTLLYFNYSTNIFTRMLTRDHSSDYNKYWLFNFSNFKVQNEEICPQTQLIQQRQQVQGKPQMNCF